jgi:hypothetical protein
LVGEYVGENKKANDVQEESYHSNPTDSVHYLSTQNGFLRISTLLKIGGVVEETLRIDVEVFPGHFDCVFHFLCVLLKQFGFRVGDIHEVGQFVLAFEVGLDAVHYHQEVDEKYQADRGVEESVFEHSEP